MRTQCVRREERIDRYRQHRRHFLRIHLPMWFLVQACNKCPYHKTTGGNEALRKAFYHFGLSQVHAHLLFKFSHSGIQPVGVLWLHFPARYGDLSAVHARVFGAFHQRHMPTSRYRKHGQRHRCMAQGNAFCFGSLWGGSVKRHARIGALTVDCSAGLKRLSQGRCDVFC